MTRNNPPHHCVANPDLPRDPDQDPDVAIGDATGDSTPDGGSGQDRQPD